MLVRNDKNNGDVMSAPTAVPGKLRSNAVGVWSIVFFVIATNGPLTGLVGAVPTAILMGNGIGLPAAFLLAGIVYLLFSVGFVAMGRYVRNAGAFYAYVSHGLGRPLGCAAAFLAIVGYTGLQIACYGLIGYFAAEAIGRLTPWPVQWWEVAVVVAVLVHLAGRRNIAFNGRLLGLLMLAEMLVITVVDVAIVLWADKPEGFTLAPFAPSQVFVPGLGAAFVFVAGAFMGFETTAIYAEEARQPERSVPLATYIAVSLIMLFFVVSSWLLIVANGAAGTLQLLQQDAGSIWFVLTDALVGHWLSEVINVLLITSLFAVILSFHNTLSRYFYALGREGILWHGLAKTHSQQDTPYVASTLQTVTALAALLVCAALGADPMLQVLPLGSAPASIGVLAVQALTCLAVIRFFATNPRHASLWQRRIAPLLALAGLLTGEWMIVAHMGMLTGSESGALNAAIPLAMLAVGVFGAAVAYRLRSRHPERYANLTRVLNEV
ncbi:MAG: putative amino acid permease YhdG [Pseudomonas citronellolis]|nr:MAG: putative amino acid permease YhdG [Pseudomonas citronellolis]